MNDIIQDESLAAAMVVKSYDLSGIPVYRKPVIEELICASDIFQDDYDTPENLDGVAKRIFDVIVEKGLLDAHLRENLTPENHD